MRILFVFLSVLLFSQYSFASNCSVENPPHILLKTDQNGIVIHASVARSSGSKIYDQAVVNHYKGKPYYMPYWMTIRKGQFTKPSDIPSPQTRLTPVLVKNRTLTVMDGYIQGLVKEDCY